MALPTDPQPRCPGMCWARQAPEVGPRPGGLLGQEDRSRPRWAGFGQEERSHRQHRP